MKPVIQEYYSEPDGSDMSPSVRRRFTGDACARLDNSFHKRFAALTSGIFVKKVKGNYRQEVELYLCEKIWTGL